MKKIDLFLGAMKAESFRYPQWIRGAFAIVEEDRSKAMAELFAYRVLRTGTTCFAADPNDNGALALIEDATPGQPIFAQHEKVTLTKDMGIPGITQDTVTTYGCWLLNAVWIFYPFGNTFKYQNRRFFAADVEDMVKPIFRDNPKEGEERVSGVVYVSDYLNFAQSVRYLEEMMHIFTPAGSEKTMTCDDGLIKLKKELFAKYRDQLSDPAILARISQELEAYDRAWMKGDIGLDSLLDKRKDFPVVRRKLFGFQGGEAGFDDGAEMVAIENSLSEGWDLSKFPSMVDVSRVGSYNRGVATAMGGDQYKKLLRATSTCRVTKEDCGVSYGMPEHISADDIKNYIGLNVVTKEGHTLITEDNCMSFVNKPVTIRAPNFCRFSLTDYCETCVGARLAANKTGLSGAVSRVGNVFMGLSMQGMHGKALSVTDYNYEEVLI